MQVHIPDLPKNIGPYTKWVHVHTKKCWHIYQVGGVREFAEADGALRDGVNFLCKKQTCVFLLSRNSKVSWLFNKIVFVKQSEIKIYTSQRTLQNPRLRGQ
jgi:hypothetical protein